MAIIGGYQYDIFISYRHKDNKGDQWITKFVSELRTELESTFKENISIYFDTNAHDGLSDHHDVDLSLQEKVKSLIFIPIISRTYCDPNSFAWRNEFLPFLAFAKVDPFGLKVKVANGNVASRILPIRIHELDEPDLRLLEKELGGVLRPIDFIFKSSGVNRPLGASDKQNENSNKTIYRDQINRVANAIKEIVEGLKVAQPFHDFGSVGAELHGLNNTIPISPTALFGRDEELDELNELLKHNRVLSVIGSGGMGKTRLAIELCHRLKGEFPGTIAFASMAALTDAKDVIPTLANTLGVKEAEGRDLTKGIASAIGDRKVVLVLDNLEQVIGVAPQVAELISSCSGLRILTTSRTPLKISAEYEYSLSPLALPSVDSDRLNTYPSVALFVDRAKKVNANFSLTSENSPDVIQICRRLDGLPLALELAAARIRMMSTKQLLQKLDHALEVLTSGPKDLPQRHQTLRSTIDWSHSLLNQPEKNLFRRMAVFSGGCTLEGIMETCYEQNSSLAFDELESLVDKGLVQRIGLSDRFIMLQTIKEYATERLNAASEENDVRVRQAKYFLKIANQIRHGLESKDQLDSMRLGILEESNLESILDFLYSMAKEGDADATEIGLTICGQLFFFWHIRGKHIVARHWSNLFLSLSNGTPFSRSRSLCLNTVGLASSTLGKHEQSIKEHRAAYEIAVMLNDKPTMIFASLSMFIANLGIGKLEEADACVMDCKRLSLEAGSDFDIGFSYSAEGIMHSVKGELDAAKATFDKALAIQNKIPDLEGGGLSLGGLALLSSIRENYDQSLELYRRALHSFVTIGDRAEEARILEEMAWVFLKNTDANGARKHFLDSIQAYEDVGSVRGIGLALLGIACVESVEDRPSKAIEIATAAQVFTEQEGVVNNYGEGFQGKVYLDNARSKLSNIELDKALELGKKLSVKETLQMITRV